MQLLITHESTCAPRRRMATAAQALLHPCRCQLNRPDSCEVFNTMPNSIMTMMQLPAEASVIYVGTYSVANDNVVSRCSTATRNSCSTVANINKKGVTLLAPVPTPTGLRATMEHGRGGGSKHASTNLTTAHCCCACNAASTMYVGYEDSSCSPVPFGEQCKHNSWVSWMVTDACPDRTVISINSVRPHHSC